MRALDLAAWLLGATAPVVALVANIAFTNPAASSPAPYEIVGDGIPESLTSRAGDAANGRAVFLDRDRGHCLLCHAVTSLDAPFHGNIGPDLSAVGDRLSAAQLRLRLVDSTLLNAETVMPAYHRVHDLRQVGEAYVGKPVLAAQEVEDMVAFLVMLRARETTE